MMLLCAAAAILLRYIPPQQYRHEQLTAMQAAFSRFGASQGGMLDKQDLPDFLLFVVKAMNSAAMPQDQVVARSSELAQKLVQQLPAGKQQFSLIDILRATEQIIVYPKPPAADEAETERGRMGTAACRSVPQSIRPSRDIAQIATTPLLVRVLRRLQAAANAEETPRAQPADDAALRHTWLGARLRKGAQDPMGDLRQRAQADAHCSGALRPYLCVPPTPPHACVMSSPAPEAHVFAHTACVCSCMLSLLDGKEVVIERNSSTLSPHPWTRDAST